MNRRLYRSVHDRVLGGVAGGVADYFDLDPSLVRVAWAILILASVGGFLLLYIVMWIVVPEAPADYVPSGRTWGPAWGGPPPVPPGSGSMPSAGPDQAQATGSPQGEPATSAASAGSPPPPEPGAPASQPGYGWYDRRYDRYRRHRSGGGGIVIGALLVLVGVWFLARDTFNWIHLPELWPILIIGLGLLLLYGAVRPRHE